MLVEEVGAGSSSGGYDMHDKRVVIWPVRRHRLALSPAPAAHPCCPYRAVLRIHTCALASLSQVYIDANKTIADGRKLPKKACCEYPQMHELKEVLDHLGFEHAYEEKVYPRDLTQYGRFRVLLKDPATGAPVVEGIDNRRKLLLRCGELIPNLKSRKGDKKVTPKTPGVALPGYPETLMPVAAAAPPPGAPGGAPAGGGGGSSKKKGKSKG